jgi:hypothetical protein
MEWEPPKRNIFKEIQAIYDLILTRSGDQNMPYINHRFFRDFELPMCRIYQMIAQDPERFRGRVVHDGQIQLRDPYKYLKGILKRALDNAGQNRWLMISIIGYGINGRDCIYNFFMRKKKRNYYRFSHIMRPLKIHISEILVEVADEFDFRNVTGGRIAILELDPSTPDEIITKINFNYNSDDDHDSSDHYKGISSSSKPTKDSFFRERYDS